VASLWREATRSLHSPAALFSGENLRWDGWSIRLGDSLDESTELTTSPRGLWAIIDQDSLHNLYFCISSKINVANLFKEMEAATPIGALDEVFTQYCDQIPELMNCAEKVTDAMSVCLGDQGKEDLKTFVGVVDAALEFLCYKGGERIAIFLAEKGSECLVSSVDRLMGCLNESLPSFTNVLDNMHSLNLSIYDPANCKVEVQVKGCVVDALKSCSDPTPSNVIEGLMNSMERATPCFVPSFASTFTTTWLYSLLVGLLLPLRSIANRY